MKVCICPYCGSLDIMRHADGGTCGECNNEWLGHHVNPDARSSINQSLRAVEVARRIVGSKD